MTTQAQRICRSKKKYESVKSAAMFQAHVYLNHKQMQHVYKCPECGKYHLTSENKKERHYA